MLIKSIMWDTNNDNEALASLPDEIETPNFLHQEDYKTMDDFFAAVAEWLIYEFGWCHFGFQAIVNDNTYDVSYSYMGPLRFEAAFFSHLENDVAVCCKVTII